MKDLDYIPTEASEQAKAMCAAVLNARPYCRIGQIIGHPGTGKSALTHWLADEFAGIRIEVWTRIADKEVLRLIVEQLNQQGAGLDTKGTGNTLFKRLVASGALNGKLLIVDEANHLRWAVLEILRSLSDLSGAGLVIVGTDILGQRLASASISTYLAQLRQRIGAKRVTLGAITSDQEINAYCIAPRFGAVTRQTAKQFRELTGGYWRAALELGDACARLMQAEQIDKLDETVVQTAAAFMAGAK